MCACGCETSAGPLSSPPEATGPACYGPNVKAYAIYLLVRHHIPQERCAEALADMYGLHVSVGTLNNWLTEAAEALVTFLAALAAGIAGPSGMGTPAVGRSVAAVAAPTVVRFVERTCDDEPMPRCQLPRCLA